MPHGFKVGEGAQLAPNCLVGHQLGEGIQVRTTSHLRRMSKPLQKPDAVQFIILE